MHTFVEAEIAPGVHVPLLRNPTVVSPAEFHNVVADLVHVEDVPVGPELLIVPKFADVVKVAQLLTGDAHAVGLAA